ncbi:MAG: PIG-L family deacetylase [Anaerolineales bacterium]|jgi:LmbE family N-acetylglucosaminyl deacetylase
MTIIYLSPHLDDAALSCGGLIWEQSQSSVLVEIWTICAGDPPMDLLSPLAKELHQRWQLGSDAVAFRREEDKQSCRILGVKYHHFCIPDAIYRLHPETKEYLYDTEEAIFNDFSDSEYPLLSNLAAQIAEHLPPDSILISPLSLGNHIDHQLTRQAAMMQKALLVYYADYPYINVQKISENNLQAQGYQPITFPVSQDGLNAWQDSIAVYRSQISSFWENVDQMKVAIDKYHEKSGGVTLWCMPDVSLELNRRIGQLL